MPYISKTQRERARWVTLAEAINHIRTIENLTRDEAWHQLRTAIADNEVLWKWDEPAGVLRRENPSRSAKRSAVRPSRVPKQYNRFFWESAQIDFTNGGRVLDDVGQRCPPWLLSVMLRDGTVRYRPLLILREAVEKIWVTAPIKSAQPQEPNLALEQNVNRAARRGVAALEAIRKAAIEVYKEAGGNPPNLPKAEQLVRAKVPGASRTMILPILNEDQFSKLRRKPGNQPKS